MNLVGTWTRFRRESRRFLKVYLQTILSPVISNLLYLAIFGLSLNRAIPEIAGLTYLEFLAPGLIMMGLINNCFQNPSSSIMISKYQGHIEDLLTIPLSKFEILISYVASAVLRGVIVALVIYLTIIFFVDFAYPSILILLLISILSAFLFAFLGVIVGVWADEFDNMAIIQNFVLTPMTFLGGVFYRISNLPEIFQKLSEFNPIVYMIDLFRYSLTGVNDYSVASSLTIVSLVTLVSGLLAYFILRTGWKIQN